AAPLRTTRRGAGVWTRRGLERDIKHREEVRQRSGEKGRQRPTHLPPLFRPLLRDANPPFRSMIQVQAMAGLCRSRSPGSGVLSRAQEAALQGVDVDRAWSSCMRSLYSARAGVLDANDPTS
ncbi:unnamed protein product, partial [Pleuronectes platessa]